MKGFSYFRYLLSTMAVLTAVGGLGGAFSNGFQALAKQSEPHSLREATSPTPGQALDEQARQFLDQGVVRALEGDYLGAIQSYNQSIQLGSSNPMVYYNRGVALHSIGHDEAALQDFNRVIQLDPSIAEAYGNRGALRLEQQDREGAIQDFQIAIELLIQRGDRVAAQDLQNWMQRNDLLSVPHR